MRFLFWTLIAALALPAPAFAADEIHTERVAFKDGRAVIRGAVKGYGANDYVFPVGAGESMKIDMKTNLLSAYFNLTAPGAQEAAFIGSTSGESYSGIAPVAGDYTVRVYMMRSDARRGKTAKYTLTIALGQKSASDERGPDFADGLAGGPDYWEVTGVPAGDTLKVRATPSPKGKIVTQAVNAAVMKNHGCKLTRGERWCQVEDGAGRTGWVNGRYLREGAGPR